MTSSAAILLAFVAAVLVGAYFYTHQRRSRAQTGWQIGPIIRGKNFSAGYPDRPQPLAGGVCAFDFVTGRHNHVHYLTRDCEPLAGAKELRVRFSVHGAGPWLDQETEKAGRVLVYIEQRENSWSSSDPNTRWWARDFMVEPLTAGAWEMVVPLDVKHWTNVNGQRDPNGFAACLVNTGRMGLTFGGGKHFGHGVFTLAPGRFELWKYEVTR